MMANAVMLPGLGCEKELTCPWDEINKISVSGTSVFQWNFYNKGGEGYAYHDNNSGAYKVDKDGVVEGYKMNEDEVDVFSQARKFQFLNIDCPWSTVEDNVVVSFDSKITTNWMDTLGNHTYKSLNAGRNYCGDNSIIRPDEGVDLFIASCKGTEYENKNYTSIEYVEEGEWIHYTVDVEKAGYYKLSAVISSAYSAPLQKGEISIVDSEGYNILRTSSDLKDTVKVTSFGFDLISGCADQNISSFIEPWNCWAVSDAKSGEYKDVYCYFDKAGLQRITISFLGNANSVGPLLFSYAKEFETEPGMKECEEKKPFGPYHTINKISKKAPSLFHWNYFNEGGPAKAYYDNNTSAYKLDKNGNRVDYNNKSDEVDVFSSALDKEYEYFDSKCPWSTTIDCNVKSYDKSIASSWADEDGNHTYKSLNAGRCYCGDNDTIRPDEEVDLFMVGFPGTVYESERSVVLGYVEQDEWIKYTVDVQDPGYYRIRGLVSSQYFAPNTDGEILIYSKDGNMLRLPNNLKDENAVYSFGFPLTIKCASDDVDWYESWACWQVSDAKSEDENVIYCKFEKPGLQEITIYFQGDAGGVGPLIFEYAADPEPKVNKITPNEPSVFHWNYYDDGGEGIAYHDANTSAYKFDDEGVVIDYNNKGDEVDVFSLAKELAWMNKVCPWSTIEGDRIVSYDKSISTSWKDEYDNSTYKSLNGGRNYCGYSDVIRPDEGVDLAWASCKGTPLENKDCTVLGWVEEDEWINYTVDVEKPGYYTISAIVGAEYVGMMRDGEIKITSALGNHLRSVKDLYDAERVASFGFPRTTECADSESLLFEPWDCWTISNARSGGDMNIVCLFPKAGKQNLTISFVGNAGGVGPMFFTFHKDYEPDYTEIREIKVNAADFSIAPNPTSGRFTITLSENEDAHVDIENMAGQVIYSADMTSSTTIDKSLAPGVYSVVVRSAGGVNAKKLIVK